MASSTSFLDTIAGRRSVYALTKTLPIPDSRIHELVEQVLLKVPSAFNSQPIRASILLHSAHTKFWSSVITATEKSSTDAEHVKRSVGRIQGFEAGAGTVLFFTDEATVQANRDNIPAYASFFGEWAQHAQGMHQFALWSALSAEGVGANLQHYQFLGDEFVGAVKKDLGLPEGWSLSAQLVFGGKADKGPQEAKEKKDLKETLKVFGEGES